MKPILQYQINLSYFESTYYKTPESLPEFQCKPLLNRKYSLYKENLQQNLII